MIKNEPKNRHGGHRRRDKKRRFRLVAFFSIFRHERMIGFMRIFWDKAFRDLNRAILTYKFGESKDGKPYETDPSITPL